MFSCGLSLFVNWKSKSKEVDTSLRLQQPQIGLLPCVWLGVGWVGLDTTQFLETKLTCLVFGCTFAFGDGANPFQCLGERLGTVRLSVWWESTRLERPVAEPGFESWVFTC
jgi:hypothetical protein